MKRELKNGRGRIRVMSIDTKVYNNLRLLTSIFMLVYLAGCSDEIETVSNNQSLTTIGNENTSLKSAVQPNTLMVWGDNTFGQISNAPRGKLNEVALGGSINGLVIRWDKTPYLWGTGPIGPPPIPEEIANSSYISATIGRDDAVLIRQDHTLAAFGKNEFVVNVPSGLFNAVTVATVHAVAIREDGTLKAWGSDSYSTTGGILTGLLNAPSGGPFIAVVARTLYTLALHEDGTIYGWGHESYGINVLDGWTPTPEDQNIFYVPGEKFKSIAAGNVHALAIRPNGTVTGWGDGTGGALNAPSNVRFKAIAAGWGFSIGLSTNGTLWGWGTPFKGPFASEGWTFASQGWTRYADTDCYYVPDKKFKSISAAAFHIMAITAGS